MKSLFEDDWNNTTKLHGFEFFNLYTNEYEYAPIYYDGNSIYWNDASFEIDHDFSMEWNLNGLFDQIMTLHPELE